jgi:hypothetical protein
MVRGENIEFLRQLAEALEKSLPRLERAYEKQSSEEFSKVKKFVLDIQKKILEAVEA